MKFFLAFVLGIACLAPVAANAEKVYHLYWISYYPTNIGKGDISLADPKPYASLDECQAAQAHYGGPGGIRWYGNTGYYMCM
jgi:hypothetical protein